MKKATSTKKWLWLVTVVAIMVAMACMFTACGEKPEATEPTETIPTDLYWNLDKALYTENSDTGLSTRERAEDGLYHVRFVCGGKLVELTTSDAQIVNYIDTMDVMGLILDADGNITDAVPAAEFVTEVAKEFFVKKVQGNNVQLNSSPAMNGMDVNIVIPDTAFIMDGRKDTETPGEKVELEVMDTVWVYADMDNVVTNVILSKRPPKSEFYVRVNRFYASGKTTRVPDKDGVYTIPFAVNGQLVDLKCKDVDLVSSIDSGTDTGAHMGLVFDEEGYIIEDMSGAEALRCAAAAIVFHVKEINGDQVTLIRRLSGSNQGSEITLTVNENTQIINTEDAYMSQPSCWAFDQMGQLVDSLQVDDRVIAYADSDGNAKVITILCRMVDAKMYFNKSVKYSSAKKETTRTPDADGYYVFEFACEGKAKTLKTKSKKIATAVDSYSAGIVGLKVSGSIIKDVCSPYCVAGNLTTAKLIAREMLGNVVTLTSRWDINNVGGNYVIAEDCKIFDVTGNYGVKYGSKTTVKPGDHVYGIRNPDNELAYIYVTKRLVSGTKLYYNTWRRYNTTTGETTRPADADGYYVYDLLTEKGKLIQAKTNKKEMADFIDLQLAPFVALKINSKGIITKAAFCESALEWGMKYTNYHYIRSIDYTTMTYNTYYYSGDKQVDSYTNVPISENVKMYNFSTNYKEYRGEKTKVRKDDRVQAFYDAGQNKVSHIYVLERYDPAVKKYCPHCDKKVTFYGYKNGTAPAGETTHYYIANDRYLSQLAVGATKVDSDPEQKRTTVVLDLNGKTLNGSSSRVALVYGDMIVFDSKGGGGVTGNLAGMGGAFLIRETGTLTLKSGTYTYSSDEKYKGASMGGVACLYEDTVLNIEKDAVLVGGRSSGTGGLIHAYGNAVVNVDGASLSGGTAASNGGNIYLAGNATFNMNSGKLLSGTAGGLGNNVYIGAKTVKFNLGADVEFDGGIAFSGEITYPITGTVNWTNPVVLRNGAKLDLTGMSPDSRFPIDADGIFTTNFADAATAKTYLDCFTVPADYKPVEVNGKALSTELVVEKLIEREMVVANAVKDLNPAEVVAGNTCPICGATNVTWTKQEGTIWVSGTKHIYYEGALGTAEEPIEAGNFIAGDEGAKLCVVLVDADIHTTGRILLRPNNVYNFMGKGTITSNGATTASAGYVDRGLFNFVGTNIELNLYGGNYQYTGAGFGTGAHSGTTYPAYALLNVSAQSQANIFNDVVIGPAEKDTSRGYKNAYVLGDLNMFGGTIQNGVALSTSRGSNVHIASGGALNMYGGTIKDGYSAQGYTGGNVTIAGSATLNMYAGTISGGETTFRGGNVLLLSSSTLNMEGKDALITKGVATAVKGQNSGGGNIGTPDYVSNVILNMNAGTISDGKATSNEDYKGGGNIYAYGYNKEDSTTVKINLNGGSVTGGEGYMGGSIYIRNHVKLTIGKDAVISGGYARYYGGNIMPFNGPVMVSEGKIINGTAVKGGGNINIGHSSGGKCYFTMNGGEISGGTVVEKGGSNFGGNIRLWDNATFTVNDGYIYGGNLSNDGGHGAGANIMAGGNSQAKMADLIINGGHIAGDIKVYAYGDRATKVVLSGAPEIAWTITLADGESKVNAKYAGMLVMSGATLDISGLKPEAKILVSAGENAVISDVSENAVAVAGCFTTTNPALTVEATAEKVLKVVAVPVTPEPAPAA